MENEKQTEITPEELESEYWNTDSSTSSDYIKLSVVRDNHISAIKLTEYLGMKLTAFKDKENTFRPNFKAEVVRGDNIGKSYVVSFSKPTADSLLNELKTKEFKAWVGRALTVAIKQKGKFEGIDYSVYVALNV
jgi:hypothetical protein